MKKLQILLLFIYSAGFAQTAIPLDEELYNNGISNYEIYISGDENFLPLIDNIKNKKTVETDDYYFIQAYENFKKIVKNFPHSKHYNLSLYHVGNYEFAKEEYQESKLHLTQFIEKTEPGYEKRLAYFTLAEIAIYENDRTSTEKYLELISTSRPKFFTCGNASEQDVNREKFIIVKAKKIFER